MLKSKLKIPAIVTAVILAIVLLANLLSVNAASNTQKPEGVYEKSSSIRMKNLPPEVERFVADQKKDGKTVKLVNTEVDDMNTFTFYDGDGSLLMYIDPEPQKFEDEETGEISLISNKLVKSSRNSKYIYENESNSIKTYFPHILTDGIFVEDDQVNLKFYPVVPEGTYVDDTTISGKAKEEPTTSVAETEESPETTTNIADQTKEYQITTADVADHEKRDQTTSAVIGEEEPLDDSQEPVGQSPKIGLMANKVNKTVDSEEISDKINAEPKLLRDGEAETDSVVYENAFDDGISLKYTPKSTGLKEDIILERYTGANTFDFILEVEKFVPDVDEGQMITFIDPETEEEIFSIDPVDMKDSYEPQSENERENYNPEEHYTLNNSLKIDQMEEGKYRLTITVDKEFLEARTTVWPVQIDPTITIGAAGIVDLHVTQGIPAVPFFADTNWTNHHERLVGNHAASYGECITYVRTTGVGSNTKIEPDKISSASFSAYANDTGAGPLNISVRDTLNPWNTENHLITWNNQPGLGSAISSGTVGAGNQHYSFAITGLYKQWLRHEVGLGGGKSQDYGFALTAETSGATDYKAFSAASYYPPSTSIKPYITVTYPAGWHDVNGTTYYYDPSTGALATGWKEIDGKWHYFRTTTNSNGPEGAMITGFADITTGSGTHSYYFRPAANNPSAGAKGAMCTGWQTIDGKQHYFRTTTNGNGPEGAMITGFADLTTSSGTHTYYFRPAANNPSSGAKGSMCTDWQTINGDRHYFLTAAEGNDPEGAMLTGFQEIEFNNITYTFYFRQSANNPSAGAKGSMLTGFNDLTANSVTNTYYFRTADDDPSTGVMGSMCISWQEIDEYTYDFEESGAAHAGWLDLSEGGDDDDDEESDDNDEEYDDDDEEEEGDDENDDEEEEYDDEKDDEEYDDGDEEEEGDDDDTDNDGCIFYFDPASKKMKTGWHDEGGYTFYYRGSDQGPGKPKGSMVVGWCRNMKTSGGATHYFRKSNQTGPVGAMMKGWCNIKNRTYYFHGSPSGNKRKGYMTTGWCRNMKTSGNATHYFRKSDTSGPKGSMMKGWCNIPSKNGYRYYFHGSKKGSKRIGHMATGWRTMSTGYTYNFRSSENYPATGPKGAMCTGGPITIGGSSYTFFSILSSNPGVLKRNLSAFSVGDDNMKAYKKFCDYSWPFNYTFKKQHRWREGSWPFYTYHHIDKNVMIDYLVNSDVAFIDGHGVSGNWTDWNWLQGNKKGITEPCIPSYNGTGTFTGCHTNTGYVCTRPNCCYHHGIRLYNNIGTSFKDSAHTKTKTPFRRRTKWLIIQACAQLDLNDNSQNWDSKTALLWARALLGDGNRMHGVLSYYDKGPGGNGARNRLVAFMDSQKNNPSRSIVQSWKEGNELKGKECHWAAVYHQANYNDNMFNGFKSNTKKGTTPTIMRWRYDSSKEVIMPEESSSSSSTSGGSVSSSQNFILSNADTADHSFSLDANPLTSGQKAKINAVLNTGENTRLEIDTDGKVTYTDGNIDMASDQAAMDLSNEQAIQIAEDYLRSMDILPSGNYTADVSWVQSETLDLVNGTSYDQEKVSYTVTFRHTYDGVPILSADNEGIRVCFTGEGLRSLNYRWSAITPVSQTQSQRKTVGEVQALYLNEKTVQSRNISGSIYYQQVYVYENGQSVPYYVFGDDGPYMNAVYINAITGDALHR